MQLSTFSQLTILNQFGQHVPGVNIQHNQSSQGGSVLLVQLAPDLGDNVRDLTVVQFKVSLHRLYNKHQILNETPK